MVDTPTQRAQVTDYDTVVIGAGPGGSTAGALLVKEGQKVLILEKETFPRFHIGESLIPFGNDVLQASGAWEKIQQANFVRKLGADFTIGNSQGLLRFWFADNMSPNHSETFQVERAKFDELLLRHAASLGAEVKENARVDAVAREKDAATVTFSHQGSSQTIRTRWLLDATGRDAFLGKAFQLEKDDLKMPKRIAIYAHYANVRRNTGKAVGNITIVRLEEGWFWIIPLDEEKTSVGLVQRLDRFKASGLSPAESIEQTITGSSELQYRLSHAQRLCDYYSTGDYTYRHKTLAGTRWILVGDAAGFIDPIFSSGVMVALRSARLAAKHILNADKKQSALSSAQQSRYTREVHQMTDVFLKMIRMYYDNSAFEVFMNPNPLLNLPRAVNNLVSGNTHFGFFLWLRVQIFFLLCRLQKRFRIAPRLNFKDKPTASTLVS